MDERKKMWHSELWKGSDDHKWRGAMSGFVDPGKFAKVIGDPEYGPLFAYMYRRFGVPEFGSDDHKEIANWYITTPDPNVMLCVSPRPSASELSFGYMINTVVYQNQATDVRNIVESALLVAMKDLLTSVYVRDVPINATGRMFGEIEEECPKFKWAGYGVNHKYFEEEYGGKKS